MTLSEARMREIEAAAEAYADADMLDDEASYSAYIAGAVAEAERASDEMVAFARFVADYSNDPHVVARAREIIEVAPYREAEAPRIGTLDTFFDAVERRRGEAEADGRAVR